jgi:hypothetical protein
VGNDGSTSLTFDQLRSLLSDRGYLEHESGDRIAFIHPRTRHIISLDKPPGQKYLTSYQLQELEAEFSRQGLDIPDLYNSQDGEQS